MRRFRRFCFLLAGALACACAQDGHIALDTYDPEQFYTLPAPTNEGVWGNNYEGLEGIRTRAAQFAQVQWLPLRTVPSRYGGYPSAELRQGLPYSLGIFADSYVGTQVSLYTYLTAIRNPYSVMYSEDLRGAPYNGFDCASYYGTICSNSVWYVLGLEPPYYTTMVPAIPGMKKAEDQRADAVEPFDVIWKQGHVFLVLDTERDAEGNLVQVRLFETTSADQKDTWIHSLPVETWREKWTAGHLVRYRYSRLGEPLDYGDSEMGYLNGEGARNIRYNEEVCVARGDKASFLEGETVNISVISREYDRMELYKDGELYDTKPISRWNVSFRNLPYGLYKARLVGGRDGSKVSDFTYFEVIQASVRIETSPSIRVSFSSANGSARYLVNCDGSYNPYNFYLISEQDRLAGIRDLGITKAPSPCIKVFFRGRYGVVATPAQWIE